MEGSSILALSSAMGADFKALFLGLFKSIGNEGPGKISIDQFIDLTEHIFSIQIMDLFFTFIAAELLPVKRKSRSPCHA